MSRDTYIPATAVDPCAAQVRPVFQKRLAEISGKESNRQVARRLGCAETGVVRWRSGQNLPSVPVLVLISREYNVTTDWLLGLTNEREP